MFYFWINLFLKRWNPALWVAHPTVSSSTLLPCLCGQSVWQGPTGIGWPWPWRMVRRTMIGPIINLFKGTLCKKHWRYCRWQMVTECILSVLIPSSINSFCPNINSARSLLIIIPILPTGNRLGWDTCQGSEWVLKMQTQAVQISCSMVTNKPMYYSVSKWPQQESRKYSMHTPPPTVLSLLWKKKKWSNLFSKWREPVTGT